MDSGSQYNRGSLLTEEKDSQSQKIDGSIAAGLNSLVRQNQNESGNGPELLKVEHHRNINPAHLDQLQLSFNRHILHQPQGGTQTEEDDPLHSVHSDQQSDGLSIKSDNMTSLQEAVNQYLVQEVQDATEAIQQKMAKKIYQDKDGERQDTIDISKCQGSEEYFSMVSHQIPIAELYKLIDNCANSEENEFCAILLRIENMELQQKYVGRYLLQVWTRVGTLVYSKTLQFPLHLWNLNGKHLIFVLNEREPMPPSYRQFQQIYVVRLSSEPNIPTDQAIISTLIFKFYPTEQDSQSVMDYWLCFTDGYLIVATQRMLKYVAIPTTAFQESKGEKTDCLLQLRYPTEAQYVNFKKEVRVLNIVEIQQGKPCLITEQDTGQISFLKLNVEKGTLWLDELNDQTVKKQTDTSDRVKKVHSIIFKCEDSQHYKQCGLALRNSGSLDFLWNFRVVDSFPVKDLMVDGKVDDIASDFGFLYYKKIEFSGAKDNKQSDLFKQLKDPSSSKHKKLMAAHLSDQEHYDLLYEMQDELQTAQIEGGLSPSQQKLVDRPSSLTRLLKDEIQVTQVLKYCCNQWKERIGTNTCEIFSSDIEEINKRLRDIQDQKVANFAQIYPWFSNMQSHFCVAHSHFLSVFDITSQQWEHSEFTLDEDAAKEDKIADEVTGGFRLLDKTSRKYWAGIVLKSNTIKFVRAYDNFKGMSMGYNDDLISEKRKRKGLLPGKGKHREKVQLEMKPGDKEMKKRYKDLDLQGECLRISTDKQHQRFVLFLVREVVKVNASSQQKSTYQRGGGLPIITHQKYTRKLRIYVNPQKGCTAPHQLHTLPEKLLYGKLEDETRIFIIPSPEADDNEAFIVLDNSLMPQPQSYFFRLSNLKLHSGEGESGSPTLHEKTLPRYLRPYNKSIFPKRDDQQLQMRENVLVGYIDQSCEGGGEASVMVTRTDVCAAKLHKVFADEQEKTEVRYKYFHGRHIQAMLHLDTWMYTLSNPCAQNNDQNQDYKKATKEQTVNAQSLFFWDQGHMMKNEEDTWRKTPRANESEKTFEDETEVAASVFNGVMKDNPGLYAYDLQRLSNSGILITYKLKDAIVGVNRHIDFCNSSYRIAFLKDFDKIEMVPVPHRNTINFLGMQTKNNYLIWRESNGVLTALDKKGDLQAWVIGTGKTIKPEVTQSNIDFKEFELYQCNDDDDTYKWNWQQHPEISISLLKASEPIKQYEPDNENILAENQPGKFRDYRSQQSNPEVYMFKVLTMSNDVVREEFSFTFDVRVNDKTGINEKDKNYQQLVFSRDLNKLMEIYSDSRCSIYTKRRSPGNRIRVVWDLTYQIKKYPTPLQGKTFTNFLFSPNLNFFIDVAVKLRQFCIRSCATNQIVLWIPKGLISFKMNGEPSMKSHASRMIFESENQIRVINNFGLDTVLQLNMDEHGNCLDEENPVIIRSICKIDHFTENTEFDKHGIKDKSFISFDRTLERLVRMSQRFKVRQYHLKSAIEQQEKWNKMMASRNGGTNIQAPSNDGFHDELDMYSGQKEVYSTIMHQQLQTVDYSQPWDKQDSQFVAEMCFTILDWQIIEKITTTTNFLVKDIETKRLVQLCFNIFPNFKTVLHKFVEATVDIHQLTFLMSKSNSEYLPGPERVQVTMPVLQDINGDTALDIAMEDGPTYSINLASQMLKGIQDYPFMHSGFALVSGINKAFKKEVPGVGEFLDRRLVASDHLSKTKSLTRNGIHPDIQQMLMVTMPDGETKEMKYGAMVADVWQDKDKMKKAMYGSGAFIQNLDICYFDVPQLHEFDEQGHIFFEILAALEGDSEMFGKRSIQLLITQKWALVSPIMYSYLFVPHMVMLSTNLIWHTTCRPVSCDYWKSNLFFVFVQIVQVSYFLAIEVLQMKHDIGEYLKDIWNYFNMIPLAVIIQSGIRSIGGQLGTDQHETQFNTSIEVVGIILLWYGAFYYLRIWNEAGYLARMIVEVIADMRMFFLIYMMYHLSFAQGFYFISFANSNKDFQFAPNIWVAFRYSFLTALGDFNYTPYFSGKKLKSVAPPGKDYYIYANDNPLSWLGWIFLTTCCIITTIVMLNLLVAIISGKFEMVRAAKILFMFQERAIAIAQYQRIMPKRFLTYVKMSEEEEILYCQKLLVVCTEKEEIIEEGEPETVVENKDIDLCCEHVIKTLDDVHFIRDEVTQLKNKHVNKTGSPIQKQYTESMRIHRQETTLMDYSSALKGTNKLLGSTADAIIEQSENSSFSDSKGED